MHICFYTLVGARSQGYICFWEIVRINSGFKRKNNQPRTCPAWLVLIGQHWWITSHHFTALGSYDSPTARLQVVMPPNRKRISTWAVQTSLLSRQPRHVWVGVCQGNVHVGENLMSTMLGIFFSLTCMHVLAAFPVLLLGPFSASPGDHFPCRWCPIPLLDFNMFKRLRIGTQMI